MNAVARNLLRVLLALASFAAVLVVAEGAWSLATGRSLASDLLRRGTTSLELPPASGGDAERVGRAQLTGGAFALDTDPGVGMTMKRGGARKLVGQEATTDFFGQRVRVGPPPDPEAQRIVVLGDSVAFGYGVRDDQTFAHRLEAVLARCTADEVPRPLVRTVACPGWNAHNEVRYLLDHLGRLRPEIVVLMPVENDLDDQYPTDEVGARVDGYDPAVGPSRPHISGETRLRLFKLVRDRTPRGEELRRQAHGDANNSVAFVGESAITPLSIRRWQAVGDALEELEGRLRARGCRLLVVLRSQNIFETMYAKLVRERLPAVPVLTLFETYGQDDILPKDSHPNPTYVWAGALRMAAELLRLGWIRGGENAPPPVPTPYAERVAEPRTLEELAAAVAAAQATWREFIEAGIDLRTGIGFHQIYGGVDQPGDVGRNVMFALRNDGGERLELTLTRLPLESGIYPLELTPTFAGLPGEPRAVPPPDPEGDQTWTVTFDVPAAVRDRDYLDVQVDSSSWCVRPLDERLRMVSYFFDAARLVP